MAQMKKGANVSLTREVPGLAGLVLGAQWDVGSETALNDHLVLAALLCDSASRVLSDRHFVFFNQLASPELSVQQLETALGPDQEQLEIDLASVPPEVERIVAVLYVNAGPVQRRTLGQLRHCALRVLNRDGGTELVRSEDIAAGLGEETAMTLGEVYRHDEGGTTPGIGGWKFKVLGQAYAHGIEAVLADYGLTV